jgi:SAM-dependent methyltransferase
VKPFSEACARNQAPILAVLRELLPAHGRVLEIGSGSGQHAVYFGAALPGVIWQTSDLPENHPGIHAWIDDAALPNVLPPLALAAADAVWPVAAVDAIFSANTLHIMPWPAVERLFAGAARVLAAGGTLCIYGPFNYGGRHTAESNARFDAFLRQRDPASGIRDFEAVDRLAQANGLILLRDCAMPANNRLLAWRRAGGDAAAAGIPSPRRA